MSNIVAPSYSGTDALEVMEGAVVYNSYIVSLIVKAATANTVLDFGAGSGLFAKKLRALGYNVICVEPDNLLAERLKTEGFKTHNKLPAEPEMFNFIYTLNVLEHIDDDRAAVMDLKKALLPGGTLFVYVPAFMNLYSRFDEKIGHHRRYTKSTLLPLFEGFEIVSCRYVDSAGYFAALLYKTIHRDKERVPPLALFIFDRFVFPISRCLDIATHSFLGKNLLLIAKKI